MVDLAPPLILFLLPLAYSPGPGNLFFAAIGARFGTRASLHASLGYHAATWAVTFAIGQGFVQVVTHSPGVFAVLRYAGAAYVLWLAWTFARAGAVPDRVQPRRATALDGAMLLLLNPKAYVIIALMFSQFLTAGGEAFLHRLIAITSIFTLNNLVAFTVWTVAGDALARLFRSPAQARVLNTGFGAMLAAVALSMALQ